MFRLELLYMLASCSQFWERQASAAAAVGLVVTALLLTQHLRAMMHTTLESTLLL